MARRRARNVRTGSGNIGPGGNRAPSTPRPRARAGPLRPPPGLYDPALDAALGAAHRGYGDLKEDANRDFGEGYGGGRVGHDYLLGQEDLNRARTRGFADLDLGHARAGVDFAHQRTGIETSFRRGREDYQRAVGDLGLNYQRLGRTQAQGARQAGVLSGGLAARAAQLRTANQAHDRAPLDTGFERTRQDAAGALGEVRTGIAREAQDYTTNRGRLNEDTDLGLGRLAQGYQRANEDTFSSTGSLTRAKREDEQFGRDTLASQVFQATQQAWNPPKPAAPRRNRRRGRGTLIGTVGRPTYGANF